MAVGLDGGVRAAGLGMQAASRRWERQEDRFFS